MARTVPRGTFCTIWNAGRRSTEDRWEVSTRAYHGTSRIECKYCGSISTIGLIAKCGACGSRYIKLHKAGA